MSILAFPVSSLIIVRVATVPLYCAHQLLHIQVLYLSVYIPSFFLIYPVVLYRAGECSGVTLCVLDW